jgi:hypothetical protein
MVSSMSRRCRVMARLGRDQLGFGWVGPLHLLRAGAWDGRPSQRAAGPAGRDTVETLAAGWGFADDDRTEPEIARFVRIYPVWGFLLRCMLCSLHCRRCGVFDEHDHRTLDGLERRLVAQDPHFVRRVRHLQAQVGAARGKSGPGDRAAVCAVAVVGALLLIGSSPDAALTAVLVAGLTWRVWRRSRSLTRTRSGR